MPDEDLPSPELVPAKNDPKGSEPPEEEELSVDEVAAGASVEDEDDGAGVKAIEVENTDEEEKGATLATSVATAAVDELESVEEVDVEEKVEEVVVLLTMLEQRPVLSLRRRRFGLTTRTSFKGSGTALRARRAWCS